MLQQRPGNNKRSIKKRKNFVKNRFNRNKLKKRKMEGKRTNNRRKKTRVFEVCGPKKCKVYGNLKLRFTTHKVLKKN
jgi:hypothetical protein